MASVEIYSRSGVDKAIVHPLRWETSRAFDITQPPRMDDRPTVKFETGMDTKLTTPAEYKPSIVGTGAKVTGWKGDNDPVFTFFPGEFETLNGGASDLHMIGTTKPGGSAQAAAWPVVYSFDTDSPVVELATYGTSAGWALMFEINGRLLDDTLSTVPGSVLGAGATCTLTFPTDGSTRTIRVYGTSRPGLHAVRVLTGRTVTKTAGAPLTAAIVGDSFVNGSGSSNNYPDQGTGNLETFAPRMLRALGYERMMLAGIGGTGFTTANPYIERIPMIVSEAPDTLFLFGSVNDWDGTATLRTAMLDTFALIPGTIPVTVIPPVVADLDDNYTIMRDTALEAGHTFIDSGTFFVGTGTVTAPTGVGNRSQFIRSDGTHPTLDGHRALARYLFGIMMNSK